MPQALRNRWTSIEEEELRTRFTQRWTAMDRSYVTPCWVWQSRRRSRSVDDYGSFSLSPKGPVVTSSRASWLIYRGDIPRGIYVLHRCGLKACVNPEHLYLGTHHDNLADRARLRELYDGNGRALNTTNTPRGRRHFRAKVTPALHAEVRRRWAVTGDSHQKLAEYFHLGASTIGRILGDHPTAADNW